MTGTTNRIVGIVEADVRNVVCDLLVLKHADGFYGVDALVGKHIGYTGSLSSGKSALVPGRGIEATEVLFLGVGPLERFRYPEIRQFGCDLLRVSAERAPQAEVMCVTSHGAGYGLDEAEAFLSFVSGLEDGLSSGMYPQHLKSVKIVEKDPERALRFRKLLMSQSSEGLRDVGEKLARGQATDRGSYGRSSESKTRLFAAMLFADEYSDVWDIAIQESVRSNGMICERIDQQSFTGDIFSNILSRIQNYNGLIALLNGANPNVFLEIGFAMGSGKPVVFLARAGQELPFDVKGQKCIFYNSIADLRNKLTSELAGLAKQRVFEKGPMHG